MFSDPQLYPYLYEDIILDNNIFLLVVDDKVDGVYIAVEGGGIRFRLDGNDPDADSGFIADDLDRFELNKNEIKNCKFIKISGDPILRIAYYANFSK